MAPFHRMTYGTHLNFRETTRMLIGLGRPPGKDEKVAICNWAVCSYKRSVALLREFFDVSLVSALLAVS